MVGSSSGESDARGQSEARSGSDARDGSASRCFLRAVGAFGAAAGLSGCVGGNDAGGAENAIPRPVTVAWPRESQRMAQQANSAFSQGGQPEQAMSRLEQQLQGIEQSA